MAQLIKFFFFRSKGYYSIYDDGGQQYHPGGGKGFVEDTNDYAADTQQNDKDSSRSFQKPVDSLLPFLGGEEPGGKEIAEAPAGKKDYSAYQQEQDKETVGLRCDGSEFPQRQNQDEGKQGTESNKNQDFYEGNKKFSIASNNFLYHLLHFKKKQVQRENPAEPAH